MYAYISGTVADKENDALVLDVGGVGYRVVTVSRALTAAKMGEPYKLYTYLAVREDAMMLYGFGTREEKRMFERLLSVSGVGAKMAMAILSSLTVQDLAIALVSGDVSMLVRVPGVGKKTAQRLILELKEKVDNEEITRGYAATGPLPADDNAEAVAALVALGYDSAEAVRAIRRVDGQAERMEDKILLALKSMDAGKV